MYRMQKELFGMGRQDKFSCVCDKQQLLHINKYEIDKEEREGRKYQASGGVNLKLGGEEFYHSIDKERNPSVNERTLKEGYTLVHIR